MKPIAFIVLFFLMTIGCKKENILQKSIRHYSVSSAKAIKNDTSTLSTSKPELFSFVTELCENKGYFDSKKYTKEEIEGTYRLWFEMSGTLLDSDPVFSLQDLYYIRRNKNSILEKLDKKLAERKEQFKNLKTVNIPYWQNVKAKRYQELLDEYKIKKAKILAFSDPSVLLKTQYSKNCDHFVKALNSDESKMMEEWRKLRVSMSKNNGNPQRIMDEFENRLNSSDRLDYATIDLITFGWGNCANSDRNTIEYDEKMYNQFTALFIKIDSECDEP